MNEEDKAIIWFVIGAIIGAITAIAATHAPQNLADVKECFAEPAWCAKEKPELYQQLIEMVMPDENQDN